MSVKLVVTTFYKFIPLTEEEIAAAQKSLITFGEERNMRGLTLLAKEGINGTVCGSSESIDECKEELRAEFGEMIFKDSPSEEQPFKRWFVKVREEIVQLKDTSVYPESTMNNHLSPTEWNTVMQEEDVVVLDTRNDYETKIGKFKNAVDPNLKEFQEFPEYVRNSGIPKDKKVLMYCTGGIRCEKALIEMKNQGYEHVYQLQGGILQYLKEFPNEMFEGECFVFDHRASVDQELNPSSLYSLCPHCGDPGKERIKCVRCESAAVVCDVCIEQGRGKTCSKDCAFRFFQRHPERSRGMTPKLS